MLSDLKRIIIITGHYGSGKTNLAANLAIRLKAEGRKVTLVDMDIVNPYFRAADFKELMSANGVKLVTPIFANTNMDIPALSANIDGALSDKESTVVLDVGGDDAGATALGCYAAKIMGYGYDMLYVVNCFRLLTKKPDEAIEMMKDIEAISRLKTTRIVNNSNLSFETSQEEFEDSIAYANEIAEKSGLPLLYHCVRRELGEKLTKPENIFRIDIYVKPPWMR